LKVLFIIESLRPGGKERRFVELLKGLSQVPNFDCQIILLKDDIHYKCILELNFPIFNFKRNILYDKDIISKFSKILKSYKPGIIHCWDNIAALHFGPVAKLNKIKFINSSISTAPDDMKIFSKRYFFNVTTFPFSDIILSNSKAGLKAFHVPKKKGHYIHNGFDIDRLNIKISKEKIREKFNIESKIIVGMVASFSKMKDYDTFTNAAKIILAQNSDVLFIAVGEGENIERFRTKMKDEDRFIFTGRQEDTESIINAFDIGVLSTFTEGISNSIMEYMALGKPVIASKGGGTPELVINNETGFLIEPNDTMQLVDKINYLISRHDIAKEMGLKGETRIKEEFSLDGMTFNTLRLYKEIIKD